LGNGSIILCHNGAKYTAQALETLITTIQEKGYEIVPISELIYTQNYEIDVEGRQYQTGTAAPVSPLPEITQTIMIQQEKSNNGI
jgi:hypothetical protein